MDAKRIVRWTWLMVVVAMIYAGFTFYQRRSSNRALELQAVQREADADRKVVDQLGGGEMKILTLYASPAVLAQGGKGLLCYGVASAKEVTLAPPVDGVGPALSRCLEIRPPRTTTYTLSAKAASGRVDTRAVEVVVR